MRPIPIALGFGLMVWAVCPPPAVADPAGPTDYQTEVIAIDPDGTGFTVEIIGGDAFVGLVVEPGVAVEVIGYRGEPYLRFRADGLVEENANAPSTYLNEDRFGETTIPDSVDRGAEPDWQLVATNGSYAWHDHRTHWMNQQHPPGAAPGDIILEGVVPLLVDGVEVDVIVQSTWMPPPSASGASAGAVLGILAVAAIGRRRDRRAIASIAFGSVALTIGLIAFASVPGETDPPVLLWVLPAMAIVTGVVARRPGIAGLESPLEGVGQSVLEVVAPSLLIAWGVTKWDWIWRPVLPTDLPSWAERLVTVAVLTAGLGLAIAAMNPRPVSETAR